MSKGNTGAAAGSNKDQSAVQATASTKSDSCATGFYCYIGPSITGLIQHGAIHRGTYTAALQAASAAIEKVPLVRTLIVSGDSLADARLKVKKPGNALHQNYQRIAGKS